MICSGGVCGDKLNDSVDETMGDMGVEGKVVAGAFESVCDDGYVWVEGSSKYGTLPGFCVEQTEASLSDYSLRDTNYELYERNTNISQGEASLACQTVGKGYHLISENEWLTIADNAIKNNDNDYNKDLAGLQLATSLATGTITMTNGNKLFDFVGGVGEWTDKTITRPELVEPLNADWQEYLTVSNYKGLNIAPPYYYNNNENGIGRILTGTSTVSNLRGFVRGGSALFDLDLSHSPVEATSTIGFRCAK
jgi:hypothetical protein